MKHNELSSKEEELLFMLAEEAGEVVKACMKMLRHGPYNHNPDDPNHESNRLELYKELVDLAAVNTLCDNAGLVSTPGDYARLKAIERKRRWMNHKNC